MIVKSDIKWILTFLFISAGILTSMWKGYASGILLGFVPVLVVLAVVWCYMKQSKSELPQWKPAVLFGFLANLILLIPNLKPLFLPQGSSYDSCEGLSYELMTILFIFIGGSFFGMLAVKRTKGYQKLLGIVGMALSWLALVMSSAVWHHIITVKELHDIW